MPKKPNSSGELQEYIPAGNGDASGEYGDADGNNRHFTNFVNPHTGKSGVVDEISSKFDVELDINSDLAKSIRFATDRNQALVRYMQQFVGENFAFHDGLIATIDSGDAQHLSSGAHDNRIAELTQIEKLIKHARFEGEVPSTKPQKDNHEKYRYYVVKVKNGGEIISLKINVGYHKYLKDWHIYSINLKEKSNYRSGTI